MYIEGALGSSQTNHRIANRDTPPGHASNSADQPINLSTPPVQDLTGNSPPAAPLVGAAPAAGPQRTTMHQPKLEEK